MHKDLRYFVEINRSAHAMWWSRRISGMPEFLMVWEEGRGAHPDLKPSTASGKKAAGGCTWQPSCSFAIHMQSISRRARAVVCKRTRRRVASFGALVVLLKVSASSDARAQQAP